MARAKKATAKKATTKAPPKKATARKAKRGINRIVVTDGTIKASARARGVTVDDWIGKLAGWQKEAIATLRAIVKEAVPEATESIKWGQPVYELDGPMIFMRNAAKHVTCGFWRGAELEAGGYAMEGEGDRMRHVKFGSVDAIDRTKIAALARQAAALNRRLGDPTRRAS